MIDFYLSFADEAEWQGLGMVPEPALAIDEIGTIRRPIQQWRDDGVQVFRAIPGWHVNLRCVDDRDLTALDAFIVTPVNPVRVWATDEPAA